MTGLDRLERLSACLTNNGFQKNPFLPWFEYSVLSLRTASLCCSAAGAVFHIGIRFFRASQVGLILSNAFRALPKY
jgi:hypothetical protein